MTQRIYKTGSKWALWRWKHLRFEGRLYLSRLHLIQTPLGSIFLHWIYEPDPNIHLHNHPVHFLSILFRGTYFEVRGNSQVRRIKYFNYKNAHDFHKIISVYHEPIVTLVFASWKIQDWGFDTAAGFAVWTEYDQRADVT